MDIVQRLKTYMAMTGLPTTQFADQAQIPRPTLSQILNGRNKKISHELLEKLHFAYPTLNMMWLVFGDGEPELKANIETSAAQNQPSLFDQPAQPSVNEDIATEDKRKTASPENFQSGEKSPNIAQNDDLNISFDDIYPEQPKNTFLPPEVSRSAATPIGTTIMPDSTKRIKTIMVCYDDNSFETFTPSPR